MRRSDDTHRSNDTYQSRSTGASKHNNINARPPFWPNDSQSTLVGCALERKLADVESIKEKVNTAERVDEIRRLMAKDNLHY
jgi:Xaa-Pro aminopeptidase